MWNWKDCEIAHRAGICRYSSSKLLEPKARLVPLPGDPLVSRSERPQSIAVDSSTFLGLCQSGEETRVTETT